MRGMNIQYLRLQSGNPLPAPDGFARYKAIVVIEDVVEPDWQAAVSKWLAEPGSLYMMALGKDCNSWNDGVDFANLDQFGHDEIPDDKIIMTTWHEDESLQEVVWFAKFSAHHPTVELKNVLFLHIGSANRQSEFEALYRHA